MAISVKRRFGCRKYHIVLVFQAIRRNESAISGNEAKVWGASPDSELGDP
jgi:hypothetical protein